MKRVRCSTAPGGVHVDTRAQGMEASQRRPVHDMGRTRGVCAWTHSVEACRGQGLESSRFSRASLNWPNDDQLHHRRRRAVESVAPLFSTEKLTACVCVFLSELPVLLPFLLFSWYHRLECVDHGLDQVVTTLFVAVQALRGGLCGARNADSRDQE